MVIDTKTVNYPGLTAATNQAVTVGVSIFLRVLLWELRVQVWLAIFINISVPLLLGTTYNERIFKHLFPQELQVFEAHYTPTVIIDESWARIVKDTEIWSRNIKQMRRKDETSLVARGSVIPARTQQIVLVLKADRVFSQILPTPEKYEDKWSITATGCMEISLYCTFHVVIKNFAKHSIHLSESDEGRLKSEAT